jgi:hypothetical protein
MSYHSHTDVIFERLYNAYNKYLKKELLKNDRKRKVITQITTKKEEGVGREEEEEEEEEEESTVKSRREWMKGECIRMSSPHFVTDEELMIRFVGGLFTNCNIMLFICQQWEAMLGYTIIPSELHGNGRIWTTLLCITMCDTDLTMEMVPMFQSYYTMIYLFGMDSCPMMEYIYDKNLFCNTCIDSREIPQEKRVTSPGFLRFDARALPTLSGSATLGILRRRKVFLSTRYRTGSSCTGVQSCLSDSLNFIFETVFNRFRPCIIACMIISLYWSAKSRPPSLFVERLQTSLILFIYNIKHSAIPNLEEKLKKKKKKKKKKKNKKSNKNGQHNEGKKKIIMIKKMISRLNIIETLLNNYIECPIGNGYSKETLCKLYMDMWSTINSSCSSF